MTKIDKFTMEFRFIKSLYDGGKEYTWEQAYNELDSLLDKVCKHPAMRSKFVPLKQALIKEIKAEMERVKKY